MHPTAIRAHAAALVAAFAVAALPPTTVTAAVESRNDVQAGFVVESTIDWFEYGTGVELAIAPALADTFANTEVRTDGSVGLARWMPGSDDPDLPSVPWWDVARRARQCSTITSTGRQYVDIPFNSSAPGWAASGWIQANYGDLVVTTYDGTTQTASPFWLATPFDTPDGHVFAEIDFGAGATRTVCLNFGHELGGQVSASNPFLGQNWTAFEPLYEQVDPLSSDSFTVTNPTLSNVRVATNAAGTGAITLTPGGIATMTLAANDQIFATGAVNVRGTNPGTDDASYAPLFSKGTLFVSRTSRNVEEWCFAGAIGTTVTISTTGSAPVVIALTATDQCEVVDASSHTVITSSAPVAAYHVSTSGRDQHALYPATDDPLYGVPSTALIVGVSAAGNIDVVESTGTVVTRVAPATGLAIGGYATLGNGPAIRMTPQTGLLEAAIQQADSNGTASSSLLPIEAMSSRYVLPLASTYTAIACPRPGEVILVNGAPQTCAGTNVGKLRLGATAAGAVIQSQSGAAFHLYYQPPNDETNIFTPRLNWAQVEAVPDRVESVFVTPGTWTSQPVSAITDVWGLLDVDQVVPAGTMIIWEFACAASGADPFVFAPIAVGEPVPHACDNVDWVRLRATLGTTNRLVTPLVRSAVPEYDLVAITESHLVTADVEPGTNWLYRIHADANAAGLQTSAIETRTFTSTGDYTTDLLDSAMTNHVQVVSVAPTATNSALSPVNINVSSIAVRASTAPVGDELIWRTFNGTGVRSERTITLV